MTVDLGGIAERLHDRSLKCGADCVDILVSSNTSVAINIRESRLEHAERSDNLVVGVRVLTGKRQACISGSDVRPEALDDMAARVVEMARLAPKDTNLGLADPAELAEDTDSSRLECCSSEPMSSPSELESMAMEIEASAMEVPGVNSVEAATTSCGVYETCLMQSNGFAAVGRRNYRAAGCAAIAGEGLAMETDYYGETRVFGEDLSTSPDIGRIAGERTVERLNPTRPKTGRYPVLYDRRVSSSLIGHLLSAINGEAVARGSSWLLDGLETRVLPQDISITEDPWRKRSLASRLFDAEGLPTSRTDIVRDGILMTWILDLVSGRKLGLASTANASRGAASPPSPSVTNIDMTQGARSRVELESEMGDGLVVTSLIGSTINPTTGDYSRGASGYWVANGVRTGPVSEFTIAGNLREMLLTIIAADDADPFRRYRIPSLLVEGMTIAGN